MPQARIDMQLLKILFLIFFIFASCSDSLEKKQQVFSRFETKTRQAITDWSLFHRSKKEFIEIYPKTEEEISQIVRLSLENKYSLIVRGFGHSMNGSSVPKEDEILIRTNYFNSFTILDDSNILTEAGISVFDLKEEIEKLGYQFPFVNGGGRGPSLGGFISSGGIQVDPNGNSGIWNFIEEIHFINGKGEPITARKTDELFSYLFGSMGQFGVITKVKIKLADTQKKTFTKSFQKKIIIPYEKDKAMENKDSFLSWIGVFYPEGKKETAQKEMDALFSEYSDIFTFYQNQEYSFSYKGVSAPLLFPANENFRAYEIQFYLKPSVLKTKRFQDFQTKYSRLVSEKNYKRYAQSEILLPDFSYASHFGSNVFSKFYELKKQQDPHFIFGKTIF